MHTLLIASISIGVFATAALADQLPRPAFDQDMNEQSLRELDNDQLRLLRRAIRGCAGSTGSVAIRAKRSPCVIASTDSAVEDSGNDDLASFHFALPESQRYDENRSSTVWRAWLTAN
ncbi:MAG: hypothetical protein HOP13_05690 [Alphaproteobacteria bacterium]|nr:hypothetical protein [Alphaproteobacteria bacterium]